MATGPYRVQRRQCPKATTAMTAKRLSGQLSGYHSRRRPSLDRGTSSVTFSPNNAVFTRWAVLAVHGAVSLLVNGFTSTHAVINHTAAVCRLKIRAKPAFRVSNAAATQTITTHPVYRIVRPSRRAVLRHEYKGHREEQEAEDGAQCTPHQELASTQSVH